MMTGTPLVSIIIPSLNCATALEACLLAVRQSTFNEFEIIVVDGHSTDLTQEIARLYADKLIVPAANRERGDARNHGIRAATGEILVFIDADNVMKPDTLSRIVDYMNRHPEVDAVNGLISKEHPNPNFLSQYKNLYMHFIFSRLPEQITFLHGSLYALRRSAARILDQATITDDTARGQNLFSQGKRIVCLKDLEVQHLKKYDWAGFLKNEFTIPYSWAYVFLRYRGWRQLGKNGTGFAHASTGQLASLVLAPLIATSVVSSVFHPVSLWATVPLLLAWLALQFGFIRFLVRERGALFGILSILITFLDHHFMLLGVCCGILRWFPVATWEKAE